MCVTGEPVSDHHRPRTEARRQLARRDRLDRRGRRGPPRATWRSPIRRSTSRTRCCSRWSSAVSGPRTAGRASPETLDRGRALPGGSSWNRSSPPLREIATTHDEGQPEPLRRDAAEGDRRGEVDGHGIGRGRRRRGARRLRRVEHPARRYVQADGSGLSRYDFVTAEMIVTLLERMYRIRGITRRSSRRCRSPARTARSRRG